MKTLTWQCLVRIGVKWFTYFTKCKHHEATNEQQLLQQEFARIVGTYYGPLTLPFNVDARSRASMPTTWYTTAPTYNKKQ